MYADWEPIFRAWSKPSSETEDQKSANAVSMIRSAVSNDPALSRRSISVFPQGSYRNNTNVKTESDVDVCVLCTDSVYSDYSHTPGYSGGTSIAATFLYPQFKNELEAALKRKFGNDGVRRGSKAFDVHPNSYRVDADVVPTFEQRRYYRRSDGSIYYVSGTKLIPDSGSPIENWPEQHYERGVAKNQRTGSRFKYITRVLKRLQITMEEKGVQGAKGVPSYLIECLMYNVPDSHFSDDAYTLNVKYALANICTQTANDNDCKGWLEVNELKYLFNYSQPWTRTTAKNFADAAWSYLGVQ